MAGGRAVPGPGRKPRAWMEDRLPPVRAREEAPSGPCAREADWRGVGGGAREGPGLRWRG